MEKKELIIVDSFSLGNRFNKQCPICHQKIIYQIAQPYCQCNLYYHSHCILQIINQKDISQLPKIQCLYCLDFFNVLYDVRHQLQFKINMSTENILFLGILCFSIIGNIISIMLMNSQQRILKIVSILTVILTSILSILVSVKLFLLNFVQKFVRASKVKPIQKSIQLSAFRNLKQLDYQTDSKIILKDKNQK